jgi:hypothetical protein
MIKKKIDQNFFKKTRNFLSHPAWNGISGVSAVITVLVMVGGAIVIYISGLFSYVQNVTLWLLEPLQISRYVILSGLIVLFAFLAKAIQNYLSSHNKFSFLKKWDGSAEKKRKFLSIPLPPGTANDYLKDRYLDLPSKILTPNGVEFQLGPDALILDTNKTIRSTFPKDDGSIEFGFSLHEPIKGIKAVYFLINSGNSRSIYNSFKVGKVKLIFKDAPPINTKLILGQNIREWCIANPGDLIREVLDHTANEVAWRGTNNQGTTAVMDCLKIPVFECMKNNFLERIIFEHNPATRPPDTMGVHFSVFAVCLEIE